MSNLHPLFQNIIRAHGLEPKSPQERFEEAMRDRPESECRHPMFRSHNCWKCREGEKPCAEGNYGTCSYPHARND